MFSRYSSSYNATDSRPVMGGCMGEADNIVTKLEKQNSSDIILASKQASKQVLRVASGIVPGFLFPFVFLKRHPLPGVAFCRLRRRVVSVGEVCRAVIAILARVFIFLKRTVSCDVFRTIRSCVEFKLDLKGGLSC